jgi:hypothetical protein
MITVVVTNLSATSQQLTDLYCEVGPSGSSTASTTFTCSMAQLDSMQQLKTMVNAATLSISLTASADNIDFMSIPVEQHGVTGNVTVAATGIVNTALTFPKAFAAAPKVYVTLDMSAASTAVAQAWVDTVTATGCNIKVDVTVASAGNHCVVNWIAVY